MKVIIAVIVFTRTIVILYCSVTLIQMCLLKFTLYNIRNKCGNERLTGLALIFIYWKITLSPEEILNIIAQSKKK